MPISREQFIHALETHSLSALQCIPKSDLHSHAGRGGNLTYIEKWANVKIAPPSEPFNSLDEMNLWLNNHVKCHCPGIAGYVKRVEASFAQAKDDSVTVLALSYGVDEVLAFGKIPNFVELMDELHRRFSPETKFLPDLALSGREDLNHMDKILDANWFRGIDIINYKSALSMYQMQTICSNARDAGLGLTLKAHVGEFDTADDVMRYAEELELDQIQHGISAADSPRVMKWLADHRIQLNVCPTSNIMLKNTEHYGVHQIRRLYDYGVPVTINSDDLIIFNASVSQESMNLYCSGIMTAEELSIVRETGLGSYSCDR